MANFIETNDTIQLIHNAQTLYSFKIEDKDGKTAHVKREFMGDKEKITLSAGTGLATYIIEAFPNGYRYQHLLLDKAEGQQVFHLDNVADAVKEYRNGLLIHSKQRIFNNDQNTWYISNFDLLPNREKLYTKYAMSEGRKSSVSYTIFNADNTKKEEGTFNTNGQKDGPITTYNEQGKPEITYYENGKKLSVGQRILRFKFWKSLFLLAAMGTVIGTVVQKITTNDRVIPDMKTTQHIR